MHNVYSYLPGYLEAAYLHLAAAFGSMYAARGLVLLAAQFLHAALTPHGRRRGRPLRRGAPAREGGGPPAPAWRGTVAAAAILCVPYTVVDGSMANVEMGMIALLTLGVHRLPVRARPSLPPPAAPSWAGWQAWPRRQAHRRLLVGAPLALLLFLREASGGR
jgi:hypothetical protein